MKQEKKTNIKDTYRRFRKSNAYDILYNKGVLYFVLAFIIPFLIMLNGFKRQKIHPYGEQQMLVIDLWHQYYPFFKVVREKLLTGGSFLYSWDNGMGTNFLSLISYYAASPLNWISVFFDDDHSRDALMYILLAKIGFSGAFFSCFLRYTYGRRDFSIVIFSSMFALCSYTLGYYWNVMWFDTIALFPLVMLGVAAMCRERKWKLYTLSLALSLISNYYIGYFTCIFTMFMFIGTIIIEGKGVKDYLYKFWLILRSTAIGIGLGGFILLPAYRGLKLTYSMNNHFPDEAKFYDKWYDIIANLISYSKPATKEGLPNFACGMLALVLFGVFLFSAGIKIREKIVTSFMLVLIFVSCNLNILNYIWHGFHATNQIPHRFAFIFCFVLVAAAFRAYDIMLKKGIKGYQFVLLLIVPAFVLGLNVWKASKTGEGFKFEGAFRSSAVIAAAYIFIFIAGKAFPDKMKHFRRSAMNAALALAVICELVSNAVLGVKTVGSSSYVSYPTVYDSAEFLLDTMRNDDTSLFSRAEMTTTYTLNDSALYGYHGVSQFSSSANLSVTKFFRKLGLYASEAGNRYYYRNSTPVVNDLLGINYIMSRNGMLNNSEISLERIASKENVTLYRSRYPMSIGFMVKRDILLTSPEGGKNPFEYQNEILRRATGMDVNVFTAQPVKLVDYENMDVVKNGFGDYSFTVADPTNRDKTYKAKYKFAGVENASLYGYAENGIIDTVNVSCDGVTADANIAVKDYPIVFPMGNGQEGSTMTAEVKFTEGRTAGTYKFMAYAFKKDVYDEVYAQLADEQLELTEFTDTKITGRVNAKERGILYLSIPYEKGWSVYIDGERTTSFKVLGAMLGAEVGAGEHEIVLKYSPDGFRTGLVISGASLLVLLGLAFAEYMNRKNKKYNKEVKNEKSESNDSLQRN
jgi:uncharacterized membrane protein YfhO